MTRGKEKSVTTTTVRAEQPEAPSIALTDEQIAERAYFKWQGRGCPIGEELQDWLEAQEELLNERDQ